MSAALSWVVKLVTGLWTTFLKLCTLVLQWCADLVSLVLGWGLDAVLALLVFAVGLLPRIPDLPTAGPVPALIVQANYFVPLPTAFLCISAIGATYAAVYVYKLSKFARGGG